MDANLRSPVALSMEETAGSDGEGDRVVAMAWLVVFFRAEESVAAGAGIPTERFRKAREGLQVLADYGHRRRTHPAQGIRFTGRIGTSRSFPAARAHEMKRRDEGDPADGLDPIPVTRRRLGRGGKPPAFAKA